MDDFFAGVESRKDAWPAGRADLHWHVLFDTEQVRTALTDPYTELTHRPGIEPVAPEWLHMTVLHSGPQDDASAVEIARIIEGVRVCAADIDPFTVTFSQPSPGNVAIECLGRPGPPARALWEMTWQQTRAVVGDRWPWIPGTYWPHVSLGYAAGPEAAGVDRAALKAWLSDHGRGEVTLRADRLVYVGQYHDRREIRWSVLAEIPLGHTGGGAAADGASPSS
ncbi:2'-5' RNA ligase family protein [Actinomadura violacea]|uniref:2'-5' RNA ligase family protein n=1 Tax=Actinomadura violacea TaxID=2819934 RepID=A0ABS3RXM8_9ACTN|nr:2'-5' RNA ligase family protein [Actinomadura violacea]MBO2461517.1 2'-5' RNA ligase family protein [Actinomadura violacea]